jgi:hypothetical protein
MPLEYRFTGVSRNALDLGEGDDLVELAADLRAWHAEDRAIQVDVLAAGQLGMEPGAHLEQGGDPAADENRAARRFGDAGQHLQQCALSRSVPTHDTHHFPAAYAEGNVLQGPEVLAPGWRVGAAGRCHASPEPACPVRDRVSQGVMAWRPANPVVLGEPAGLDDDVGVGVHG